MNRKFSLWLCCCLVVEYPLDHQLIMRLRNIREIISRGTLRGRMVLASVSLSQAQLARVSVCTVGAAYGVVGNHAGGSCMQEVSGSSPLSSTQVKCIIRLKNR
jgi:hypothetical protein